MVRGKLASIRVFLFAAQRRFAGITLFAVGITTQIDEAFLAAISGSAGTAQGQQQLDRDYFTAPDFQSLNTMFERVSAGICGRLEPEPEPEPSKHQCTG